jgi:hypothetical protein
VYSDRFFVRRAEAVALWQVPAQLNPSSSQNARPGDTHPRAGRDCAQPPQM